MHLDIDKLFYDSIYSELFHLKTQCDAGDITINVDAIETYLFKKLDDSMEGNCDPVFILFSLDPGSGKSRLIQKYIREFKAKGFIPDEGVLICLATKDEAKSYADECGLDEREYAILCSDKEYNSLGAGAYNGNRARVLFTTQEMIFQRTLGKPFVEASDFHYRGKPRKLRIWDESIDPARPVYLRFDGLKALALSLRAKHEGFIKSLELVLTNCGPIDVGRTIEIPLLLGVQSKAILATDKRLNASSKKSLEALALIGGRTGVVIDAGAQGLALVGCSVDLPKDLAPLIILDASGRERAVYDAWEAHRENLYRVPPLKHDYANLNIHWWPKGAGATNIEKPEVLEEIVKGIVREIEHNPDSETLTIHRKEGFDIGDQSLVEAIKRQASKPQHIRFLNWGLHRGTNEFRHIRKAFVIGALIYPRGASHALHIAASGLAVNDPRHEKAVQSIERSEVKHHLLQAVCRCNVRNINAATRICGDAEVFLIAPKPYVDKVILDEVFPGCKITYWNHNPFKLTELEQAVVDEVIRRFSDPSVMKVAKKEVRLALGKGHDQSLTRVWKDENVRRALLEQRIVVEKHYLIRG
jgi:hypothetical protein